MTATALEGSAVAGGRLFRYTDFRIVKDEGIKMGSEVNMRKDTVGARVLFGMRTSFQQALQYSKGEPFDPQTAQEIGYATKLSSDPLMDALIGSLFQQPRMVLVQQKQWPDKI